MNKAFPWRLLLGVGLIVMGVLALLQTLNVLEVRGWAWSILFFLGGLAFLSITINNRELWWGLIPGMALLGVGGEILLGGINTPLANSLGGGMVLGSLSIAFWLIYFLNRTNWWAIIPGGVLLTLTVTALWANQGGGEETGGVFMLGLAATFALVALLTKATGKSMRWAWIPAGILGLIGVGILFAFVEKMGIVFGLALIGVGVYMAWRALKK